MHPFEMDGMRVQDGDDAVLCRLVERSKQAVEVGGQTTRSFGREPGVGGVEIRRGVASEPRGRLFGPVEVPTRQFPVVLAALVHEDVGGPLVFAQQPDKVAHGRDGGGGGVVVSGLAVGVDAGELDQVPQKVLKVVDGTRKVDGLVHPPDDGLVGVDHLSDRGGQVVRVVGLAEDLDQLFPVAHRQVDGQVLQGLGVVVLGEVGGRTFAVPEDGGDDGDGLGLALFAYPILLVLGFRGVGFEGVQLFFPEFRSFPFEFGRPGLEVPNVPVKDGRDDPINLISLGGVNQGTRGQGVGLARLHEIHPFVRVGSQTDPVGDTGHTHLGQSDSDHGVDHGRYVPDLQCLLDDEVGHQFVGVVDQLE